jgi:hypothetical protein
VTRYWVRTVIGLALCAAAVLGVDWGIYHLVRTGSCGSSSTYISTRPCPPGTGGHILALIGGIFGALAGIGIYVTRGRRGRPGRVPLGVIVWSLMFVTVAGSVALAAYGPANNGAAGAKTAAIVLGAIFVPMGLAPLPFASWRGKKQARVAELAQHGRRCMGVVLSVEDTSVTINGNPRVRLSVRAEPPGESPWTLVKTATVPRVSIPRAGDRCVVFYDPADREQSNGITFDPVPGLTPGAPAPKAVDEGDPLDRIAKLGRLRDQGLVTPEEFEAQKRRLLDEL